MRTGSTLGAVPPDYSLPTSTLLHPPLLSEAVQYPAQLSNTSTCPHWDLKPLAQFLKKMFQYPPHGGLRLVHQKSTCTTQFRALCGANLVSRWSRSPQNRGERKSRTPPCAWVGVVQLRTRRDEIVMWFGYHIGVSRP